MDLAGILSIVAIVISVASTILGAINHTHIRSNCNGTKLDVSLDIDKTSPVQRGVPEASVKQSETLTIKIPQAQQQVQLPPLPLTP